MQLVGEIELASERGYPHEFLSLVRDLAPPGEFSSQQTFPFEFRSVEMEYESYKGTQVRLRYMLRVTVVRGLGQTVVKEYPFWVRNPTPVEDLPAAGAAIKMEVGIEDCLHIEFEYDRGSYHLRDTVVGKIYFLLVRIKLKHMELEVKRRETVGAGAAAKVETETVAKYEIMDGAPVRGEVIPIRLHLAPYDLSPSYPNVHNKFGVKYSLNLVLVDEEDRRYFKQQEITLFRIPDDDDSTNASGSGDSTSTNRGTGSSTNGTGGKKQPVLTSNTSVGRTLSGEVNAAGTIAEVAAEGAAGGEGRRGEGLAGSAGGGVSNSGREGVEEKDTIAAASPL